MELKFALIGPSINGKISNMIYREFQKKKKDISFITPATVGLQYLNKQDKNIFFIEPRISLPDIGIVRGVGSQIHTLIFYRLDWMGMLEQEGVNLVNSRRCLELATNKMLTTQALTQKKIPNPPTIMCETSELAMKAFVKFGKDIVLKPLYGARGRGVVRINNDKLAENLFAEWEKMNEIFYVQKYFDHNNEDIRLLVVGDQVLCSMKRKAKFWKTNLARGAKAYLYEPSQEYKKLAIEASKAVEGEIIGVDLMETPEGPMIIEVNSVPGYLGLQEVVDFNISEKICDYIIQRGKR